MVHATEVYAVYTLQNTVCTIQCSIVKELGIRNANCVYVA